MTVDVVCGNRHGPRAGTLVKGVDAGKLGSAFSTKCVIIRPLILLMIQIASDE